MKKSTTIAIVALTLAGCNSGSETRAVKASAPDSNINQPAVIVVAHIDKVPVVELEPVTKPAPLPVIPPLPIYKVPLFIPDGITTISQHPYTGIIHKGGDVYLNYNSKTEYFQDFKLDPFTVTYKYEPLLEILITDGNEDLCIRYSWKTKRYGYEKPVCLWSNVNDGMELPDMRQAYYGYRVTKTRVHFNGVLNEIIEVK